MEMESETCCRNYEDQGHQSEQPSATDHSHTVVSPPCAQYVHHRAVDVVMGV
jgi:hypothetical protein